MKAHCMLVALLSFTVHTGSSPFEVRKTVLKRNVDKEEDRDTLLQGETIIDHIYKVNKDRDVNLYECDIQLNPYDVVDLSNTGDVDSDLAGGLRRKRNAQRDRKKLWITRVVPYEYDNALPESYNSTIQEAIAEFEQNTCLRFVRRTNENLFVRFKRGKGCWSAVGRQYWMTGVGQPLSLGVGCNHKGTIIHELMHTIGFWHEQSRPDRNQYVEVLWENIKDGEAYNFNKYSRQDIDVLSVPYDFDSIMHYGRKSFSKNGKDTMRSILTPGRSLGQRDGLTDFDIREINALYMCSGQTVGWSSWSNFGPCSAQCYKSRQRFCTSSNPSTDCPGTSQYGVQTDVLLCSNSECFAPIDGHWGRWSAWEACSSPCGFGSQSRRRSCDDPFPRYNGKPCEGSAHGTQVCKLKSCGIGPDDCEFDFDNFCHWRNDPNNPSNFNWVRNFGGTSSSNTGPSRDHTSGSGHYVYVETSGVSPGIKARLVSRPFQATSGRCLSFWYHMYGSTMGELKVHIKPATGATRTVWSESGDQGDEWKMARATILSETQQYQVVFEAVRGPGYRADIALDDIRFDEAPCYDAIGCFKDKRGYERALPTMLENLRSKIDWYKMSKTVDACATLTQEHGYKIFGLQHYGECWSDSTRIYNYSRHGMAPPSRCWNGVGKAWTNFVYSLM